MHPRKLVGQVATLHGSVAAERGVGLDVRESGARSVRCDPRKLTQILHNLVQNAVDASPEGGTVAIEVAGESSGGVRIEVRDDGPGLSDAVRGRLFTAGTTTKVAGSGLGLTIARAIAEQHGGGLALEDRPEGGCRATLRLPAQPPEIDDSKPEDEG